MSWFTLHLFRAFVVLCAGGGAALLFAGHWVWGGLLLYCGFSFQLGLMLGKVFGQGRRLEGTDRPPLETIEPDLGVSDTPRHDGGSRFCFEERRDPRRYRPSMIP